MEKLPNLHELSNERKNLKDIINDSESGEMAKEIAENALEDNRLEVRGSIEKYGGISEVKKHLNKEKVKEEKGEVVDHDLIENVMGPLFNELFYLKEKQAELQDFEMQRLIVSQADPYAKKANERLLKQIQKDKAVVVEKIGEIEKKDSRIGRAVELMGYKRGLHEEGHIVPTPSVIANLNKIGRRMINGKSMFMHGPTGTGKTSLARLAAKRFTGNDAEMVYCNPQTRESNIWGKTGIRPTEGGGIQTVDIFGPLAKAMTKGRVIIFDEFTALPREHMVFIKGIFNAKVGDSVNVVGNGKVKIASGFQMEFTANLKSEKNPERQELPPEIAREFEQNNLEVDYTPKEEAYDIMLARLMNADGSIDMSWYDLNTTLPKLCEAMEEVQIAYTDKVREDTAMQTGTMDVSGKRRGLKKFVMTQGTVEDILKSWQVEKSVGGSGINKKSFAEFLDEQLATGITFKEYPEADRILVAKILASKGFLKTLTPEALDLPKNVFDASGIKSKRGDKEAVATLRSDSLKEVHVSLRELADLDPFNLRRKSAEEMAGQFLGVEKVEDDFTRQMERRMAKILGKEKSSGRNRILTEYVRNNPQTGNPENTENIEIDIESSMKKYLNLYQETGLQVPADFQDQIMDVWERNYDAMQKAIEEKGFDYIIIAPANMPLDEIKEKMKMQRGYYIGDDFKKGGGFAGAVSTDVDKPRIILVHKAQNLKDRPELKATLGIKVEAVDIMNSLSLEDYLFFQRSYFKETGKHLDEDGYTWLPRTKSGSRFVYSRWSPSNAELYVNARGPGGSGSGLGCRASRYFT